MVPSPTTSPGLRKPSDRRLSEVARHICQPEGITSTAWPGVRDRAKMMGVPFDRWQDGIGRLALAKRDNGLYAAGIGGVVMSIPRQVGKTYLIAGIVFAMATLTPGMTIIWTAHRTRTHNETFKKMQGMAGRSKIAPYVDFVRAANGEQEIAFNNGSRIMFGARESGFGRGFDEVDVLVLDEAQILSEDAMSDMVPATNAAKNGLVFLMGTPPRPKDPGDVFTNLRRAGIEGDPDTLYVEFSAERGASPDDRTQLAKANPSYPHRTSESAIQRMKKLLGSEESFLREAYGIWDELRTEATAVNFARWLGCSVTPAGIPEDGRKAYGVKFSVDGSEVALSVALRPAEGPIHVEGIRSEPMSAGTSWLVDFLADRHREAAQIVIDGRSGSGALVNDLREAGVRNKKIVIIPTLDQVITAHSMMKASVDEGTLTHSAQEELDGQVEHALKRKIGNNGGYGWEAPDGKSVTVFEAATLAHWGAKTTTRRPGAGSSIGMVMT